MAMALKKRSKHSESMPQVVTVLITAAMTGSVLPPASKLLRN